MTDVSVYIDFKSPYAYLAIPHARRLGKELGVQLNWQPFVLDIPSYLGSARLGSGGQVVQQKRSKTQWSGIKYAYYDCRRYANLHNITLRGTEKIWDTNLAAIGMLWAKAQGDDILQSYLDAVYVPFWKRELDVEDFAVIERVLGEIGAELPGFKQYANGEGATENGALQLATFDSGIFGVPTFEVNGERFFGREHLPRIRWLLAGKTGDPPDIAYELLPHSRVEPATSRELTIAIDPSAPESYLTLEAIFQLMDDFDISVTWHRLPQSKRPVSPENEDCSRGGRHRRFRTEAHALDTARYLTPGLQLDDITAMVEQRLSERGATMTSGDVLQDMGARGFLGTPQFQLGDETFVGRQHLPLIRARLEALQNV